MTEEELREIIYMIVLAARTEGIVGGRTKLFAAGDADSIMEKVKKYCILRLEDGEELPENPYRKGEWLMGHKQFLSYGAAVRDILAKFVLGKEWTKQQANSVIYDNEIEPADMWDFPNQ
jgi:hypothetical protein